jgi:hypothetical protein
VIDLDSVYVQECIHLCDQLEKEFADASYIPVEKLSGEMAQALKSVRQNQQRKLEKISKEILFLEER